MPCIANPLNRLPKILLRVLQLFAVLYLICGLTETFCRLRHWGYPYVWPLTPPYPPFVDFTYVIPRFAHYGTKQFFPADKFPFTYPAPLAMIFEAFAAGSKPLFMFLTAVLLTFAAAGLLFGRALKKAGLGAMGRSALLVAYAGSFPLWFTVQQGNCEPLVWAVTSLGIWAFLREKAVLAAVLFGFAGSLKLYPFAFLGLFIARRQYRALIIGIAFAVVVSIACLKLETGSIAVSWQGTLAGLEQFRQGWALKGESTGFDHSIFGMVKRVGSLGYGRHRLLTATALHWYTLLSGLSVLVLFVTRVWRMPVLNQILALTVIAILVPPTSFDYTLIHLYVPCGLLVLQTLEQRHQSAKPSGQGQRLALLLFGLLLAPLTEFIVHGTSIAGEIECVALALLLFVSLRYRMETPSPTSATRSLIQRMS